MSRQNETLSLLDRLRIIRHRCPRCGTRLARRIATDQSYTRSRPARIPSRRVTGSLVRMEFRSSYDPQVRVTPVYLICPGCGFRVRAKSLVEPVD